jgi:hypothetical protein
MVYTKNDRIGSNTAPIETFLDVAAETEGEDKNEYINSYNYYVYYYSIKPRDPRLPKPTYKPSPDLEFIKNNIDNERGYFINKKE